MMYLTTNLFHVIITIIRSKLNINRFIYCRVVILIWYSFHQGGGREVIQVLSNSNPSICIHLAVNSSREFKEPRSSLYKNIYFSAIQRLHLPVDVEKVLALFKMLQLMLKSAFLFVSLHTCWLRVVDCMLFCLKED